MKRKKLEEYDVPSIKKLSNLFNSAKMAKNPIKNSIDEVYKYTKSLRSGDSKTAFLNRVDLSIVEATETFPNFIMNTVFGIKVNFAKLTAAENILKKKYKGDVYKQKRNLINSFLEDNTTTTFKYLFQSNFYSEIQMSIKDFAVIGTGCYKVYPTSSRAKPFTFESVSPLNLFFLEDPYGRPEFVFQELELDTEQIFDKYKLNKNFDYSGLTKDFESVKKSNIIEFCIPIRKLDADDELSILDNFYDDKKGDFEDITYLWGIADSGLSTIYKQSIIDFNVFKVFRFEKTPGTIWGEGLGIKSLDAFERLTYYKSMLSKAVRKSVDPPMAIAGDIEYLHDFSTEPTAINYVGDPQSFQTFPLYTNQNPFMLENIINSYKNEIRTIFMAQPLGAVGESDFARSKQEIVARVDLLKQKHAGVTELINQELLEPTFYAPLRILIAKKIIEEESEEVAKDEIEVIYTNELTKSNDMDHVQRYLEYNGIAQQLFPNFQGMPVVKPEIVLKDVADKMGIPSNAQYTAEEITEKVEQIMAQRNALAASQAASAGGDVGQQIQQDLVGG